MKLTGIAFLLLMAAACGPDPDEIIKLENKKLTDLEPVEAAKVEEAMSRIRTESEIIAKGGVLPAVADSAATDTSITDLVEPAASVPTPAPAPAPVAQRPTPRPAASEGGVPHQIQLGAFTSADGAKATAELWEKRGFPNVIHMENPAATTEYRYVVRLTGFQGYSAAFAESQRINTQFGIRSYPIQIRP